MKIAFIYNDHKLSGKLTKFFTGSYCYHVAWVDQEHKLMFDMHLIRRIRNWPCSDYEIETMVLVDPPVQVTYEYLMDKLKTDNSEYGWIDYTRFAFRWLYHLFGKSTPNANGVICSEMIYNDLRENGWKVEFSEPPSPADLENQFLTTN